MKRVALALSGFGLLAAVFTKVGWADLAPQIAAAGMALPVVVSISILRLWLQTESWATALRTQDIEASGTDLMGIRLAAQGTGYLSVLGPVISEPMKIRLVGGDGAAVATLVDTGIYWFASGVFGVAACIGTGLLAAHDTRSQILLAIFSAVFIAGLFLIARPKSMLTPLVRRFGSNCPSWLRKGEQTEGRLRNFALQHPKAANRMLWLDMLCQFLLAAEVIGGLWVLRIPFTASTVLALEVANRGIKMLTGWMPARIGADEGATAGVFAALGMPSASGLVLAVIRRVRDLVFCAIGFLWLARNARTLSSNSTTPNEVVLCRP